MAGKEEQEIGANADQQSSQVVSVARCETYDLDRLRQATREVLHSLGGMGRFVRPGMQVLLKPNLLSAADLDRAVTTHPAVVQAVAELVSQAGGHVLVGDSPSGRIEDNPDVWRQAGLSAVVEGGYATLVPFEQVVWKRLNGRDLFIAPPVLEADLIINLPKLKTHGFAMYTGAVKNLYGTIPGRRKRELHLRAPGISDFGQVLVDVLELIRPALTIVDGVVGQEGNGPGAGGTPHRYGCLAASTDPVAVDAALARAMGFRAREVVHLEQAAARGLGVSNLDRVRIEGDRKVLEFGKVVLPRGHWYYHAPAWVSAPLARAVRTRPSVMGSSCTGCGQCAEACPCQAISAGRPPVFDLNGCVGCLCCAEVCPQGAIRPHRALLERWVGTGR